MARAAWIIGTVVWIAFWLTVICGTRWDPEEAGAQVPFRPGQYGPSANEVGPTGSALCVKSATEVGHCTTTVDSGGLCTCS